MMNIRLMREEDLFQVTSLHDVLFKQSFNFEDYVQEKMFHYGIVIEIDHQIVGYLVGQIIFEILYLDYFVVNHYFLSKGYVILSNHTAIRLYEKCGFISVGTRARYYADGEDALLMTRNFR